MAVWRLAAIGHYPAIIGAAVVLRLCLSDFLLLARKVFGKVSLTSASVVIARAASLQRATRRRLLTLVRGELT